MKQKHSPLPWRVEDMEIVTGDGFWLVQFKRGISEMNQNFIVRACNNYDEMRDLVESVTTIYGANDTRCTIDAAKELLAKLEAADAE